MRRVAERYRGLPLGEIRMPWPAFRPIGITLARAFDLQALHLHRHLDQAERSSRAAAAVSPGGLQVA